MTKRQIIEKICKNGARNHPSRAWCGYSTVIDGKQFVCDGCRLYMLNNPVKISDEFMTKNRLFIDDMKMFVSHVYLPWARSEQKFIKVPDRSELESMLKEYKVSAEYKRGQIIRYYFDEGYYINAEWLIETLFMFGSDIVMSVLIKNVPCFMFKSSEGDGMIMGIKGEGDKKICRA